MSVQGQIFNRPSAKVSYSRSTQLAAAKLYDLGRGELPVSRLEPGSQLLALQIDDVVSLALRLPLFGLQMRARGRLDKRDEARA